MKLRMYLRGLGLGLIVAALVLSFGTKTENKTMTDAEIRLKAKELGMVDENSTLKAAEEKKDEEASKPEEVKELKVEPDKVEESPKAEADVKIEEVEQKAEAVEQAENTEKVEQTEQAKSDDKKEAKDESTKPEDKKAEIKTESKPLNAPYTLRIEKGYSSDRVARILEDAGVVSSAASFDKFLCSNGYDHKISTGSYVIPAGADFITIAKLITHSN